MRSRNYCCPGNVISIKNSGCESVVLVIQHAMCMPHNIMSPVACPALQYFLPHYLKNGTNFGITLLNTKGVFWFSLQLLSETFLILRRTQRDMLINVYRSSCKVPVIVVRF